MSSGLPRALDDRGGVLGDAHPPGPTQHLGTQVLELVAEFRRDDLAAGRDRDVLEHLLAPLAEARRKGRGDLEARLDLVDHQGRERLAGHVLGDQQQRLAGLGEGVQDRHDGAELRDPAEVQQDVRVLQLDQGLIAIGGEPGGDEALVEVHALPHLELARAAVPGLDQDEAFGADPADRFAQDRAELGIAIGRERRDPGQLLDRLRRPGQLPQRSHPGGAGQIEALLQIARAEAEHGRPDAVPHHGAGQHHRGGRAVADLVAGPPGDLAQRAHAHVGHRVVEMDVLGDRMAVARDDRLCERPLDDHRTPGRAEGGRHRVGKHVHAAQQRRARLLPVEDAARAPSHGVFLQSGIGRSTH